MNEPRYQPIGIMELYPHPQQEHIYGGCDVSPEFLESVRQTGIIQHPVVTPLNGSAGYQIISGHRRVAAIRQLGWDRITCIVRTYANEEEAMYDFLASNASRQKTSAMLIKEALAYLHLTSKNHANADKGLTINDVAEDFQLGESASQAEIAARIGQSLHFVKAVRVVFDDDYRESYLADLRQHRISNGSIKKFVAQWDRARTDVYNEKINLRAAADEIRAARTRAIEGATPKKSSTPKTPSGRHPRPTALEIPKPDNMDAILNWLLDRDIDTAALDTITVQGVVVGAAWLPGILQDFAGTYR